MLGLYVENNVANLIVRLVTGKIQDADNNSYHRVVSGYLTLSTIFLVPPLAYLALHC